MIKKIKKKKEITLDDLALMVGKGFEETAKKQEVNARFDQVNDRLDRIEQLILVNHRERIERLEIEVKELKDLLAVK